MNGVNKTMVLTAKIILKKMGLAGILASTLAVQTLNAETKAALCMTGINLSGAEYGDKNGVLGTNYTYPSQNTVNYFAKKGFNTVRLPFLWDRLQPQLNEALSSVELDLLKQAVKLLQDHGMKVILDPHNFGYYDGKRMASDDIPDYAFADFWTRVASEFGDDPNVYFGLMNEPYDIPTDLWLKSANAAITGIRAVGAKNLILVPGTNWSGASSWNNDFRGGANSLVMKGVEDPDNNFAYEFHQYMDQNFSGTHETCPKAAEAANALERVTAWLKENRKRGFLGEFGGSKDPECLAGIKTMADTVRANSDYWLGFTYWAAGDWWQESEGNNIQPTAKGDREQLKSIDISRDSSGEPNCTATP
jgi:endoglucanase